MKTMKVTKMYLTLIAVMLGLTLAFGDTNTEKFKVYGNCGMCESRIEKAAQGLDGVNSADWDKETKEIVVTYDDAETSLMDIHKAIAAVGHDTDMVKAEDSVYDDLPGCCQYDREGSADAGHHDHNH